MAGQLPRVGAVRPERPDPRRVPPGHRAGFRPPDGFVRRAAHGRRVAVPVLHVDIRADRQLRGDGQAVEAGPADGEIEGGRGATFGMAREGWRVTVRVKT